MNFIEELLRDFKTGTKSEEEVLKQLKELPFEDLQHTKVDHHRLLRQGIPEVIYCKNKTHKQIKEIALSLYQKAGFFMATRCKKEVFEELKEHIPNIMFDEDASLMYKEPEKCEEKGLVYVITAGTSDIPVAREASITLRICGSKVKEVFDIGAAGIHRLYSFKEELETANVIVAIAGMDGVLPGLTASLISKPVVAVPTDCGYGSSFKGITPLLTMLNSCASGIGVVNINNGFGAGTLAHRINCLNP
ncbi:MAG: nickel pincer cofactor biosynthesis protein LarB [Nitrospinae bacterium]|nr:nickel pincer cofactor biosynthesis protein LarB [Nitrospinota bacterium]